MGKSGALLRAKKKQSAGIFANDPNGKQVLISSSWLTEHDKMVMRTYQSRCVEEFDKEKKAYEARVWEEVNAEWKRRNERFNTETGIAEILSLTLSIPIKVLIETFGWNPDIGRKNGQLHRFHEAMLEEINNILTNENVSIEHVARYIAEEYGISWSKQILEEETNEDNQESQI